MAVYTASPIAPDYVKAEGQAGRMGARLMAMVAESKRGRVYLAPTEEMESVARKAKPTWEPLGAMVSCRPEKMPLPRLCRRGDMPWRRPACWFQFVFLSRPKQARSIVQFGRFARDFFARFTERYLNYYVSRALPQHVGAGRRFEGLKEKQAFAAALELHCRQASKIVESFAGGWYSKARFQKDLSEERTTKFLGYALKKIRSELRRGTAE